MHDMMVVESNCFYGQISLGPPFGRGRVVVIKKRCPVPTSSERYAYAYGLQGAPRSQLDLDLLPVCIPYPATREDFGGHILYIVFRLPEDGHDHGLWVLRVPEDGHTRAAPTRP